MTAMRVCWCGNADLAQFSPEYGECKACGTLVSLVGTSAEELQVVNDETDFYGKQYWLGYQSDDLGFPDIYKRARNDLTERNLHWLRALLKHRLPPAKILELGCSHGSFVALMRLAGYDAAGVEMSPWVVEFGQKTFGVPISVGPVEGLEIAAGSLDVIALMDVLEHLPDPVATMAHCLWLLKPEGVLLIQTPHFKKGMNYNTLVETNASFLEQLKADEHLYLFSDRSVSSLFEGLGAEHIQFEPAIFGHYDMFLAVSREPFHHNALDQINAALQAQSGGRLVSALLDLRERELCLAQRFQESESDRAVRGEQIESLTKMVRESESDRAVRGEQIESLTKMVRESESDRAARGEQIESLTKMAREAESDRAVQAQQIELLTRVVRELESDRAARDEQIESLKVDLQVLFTRPGFRWLAKVFRWPEAKKITEWFGGRNE
ncbi:MAG: methyltransferase domain-containing protein [Candidatus Accumulibacter sp.]|nr:methyltransferase domain-containing protein [Accumulibacter sp.]